MINLPDEIRMGVPDEPERTAEIEATSFRARRDENDGTKSIDLEIELDAPQRVALQQFLERNANRPGTARVVFGVPPGQDLMPPDPMGPAALAASKYYMTSVQSLQQSVKETAGLLPIDVGAVLAQTVLFYRNVAAAVQGNDMHDVQGETLFPDAGNQPIPPIPVPLSLSDASLQNLANGLLNAAGLAISQLEPVVGSTAAAPHIVAITAVQQLHDQVRSLFSSTFP